VLAAALLVPAPGTRMAFVDGFDDLTGDRSLWDLVAPGVRWGLLLLGVALVVFGLGRARRLGRPVPETLPVELRSAELVIAVGTVLERHGVAHEAAERIRAETRRRLAATHGLPGDASPGELAAVVAARHHLGAAETFAVLAPRPAGARVDLLAETAALDRLGRRSAHDPPAADRPHPPDDAGAAP
jgi:hypothetical protein